MSEEIENLFRERDALLASMDVFKESVSRIEKNIESLAFPTAILDRTETFTFPNFSYEVYIGSRLDWNQEELGNLMLDSDMAGKIKERLSVDKKVYEAMPDIMREKFSVAVTRKRGLFKIKKVEI